MQKYTLNLLQACLQITYLSIVILFSTLLGHIVLDYIQQTSSLVTRQFIIICLFFTFGGLIGLHQLASTFSFYTRVRFCSKRGLRASTIFIVYTIFLVGITKWNFLQTNGYIQILYIAGAFYSGYSFGKTLMHKVPLSNEKLEYYRAIKKP